MGKRISILQSNYIPWKGYFDLIGSSDEFVIYDEVQYTRRDWRNRNKIKTPQGLQWLTIPVETKGKYLQKISETGLSSSDWTKKHFNAIRHAYKAAPCFSEFAPRIENLYEQANHLSLLSEVNCLFIEAVCEWLEIDTRITQSSSYELASDRNERLLSICLQAGATTYLSGPAAKSYLDEDSFNEAGVEVEWMNYDGYPEYPQLHGPFEHFVSVLDLVLSVGKEAPLFLEKTS